jgi:hypothetical protein
MLHKPPGDRSTRRLRSDRHVASSAYLTVSEIFLLEIRAVVIAIFYAAGTAIGGVLSPWLFGVLIATGLRSSIFLWLCSGSGIDDRRCLR